MTRLNAPPIPVATNIWHCYPNYITCGRNDHLLAHYRSKFRADERGMQGAKPMRCEECEPFQYFLAVYSMTQSSHVTCYELSKESYEALVRREKDGLPEVPELLYLIRDPQGRSYNPYWRRPKERKQ